MCVTSYFAQMLTAFRPPQSINAKIKSAAGGRGKKKAVKCLGVFADDYVKDSFLSLQTGQIGRVIVQYCSLPLKPLFEC